MEKILYYTSYSLAYWGGMLLPGVLVGALVYFINRENKLRNALIAAVSVTLGIIVLGAIGSK